MSVCNINFAADSVAFYSDTMVYSDGAADSLCQRKVEMSPCGKFMWSGRGSVFLADRFDLLAREARDIDDAIALARAWLEHLPADLLRRRNPSEDGGQDIFLAGWSAATRDLIAVDMRRKKAPGVEMKQLERGVYLNPSVRSRAFALPPTATARQMIAAAHAQKRFDDSYDSGLCIGGVLHETVATRDGVEQRIVDLYGDYDRHAAEFGDPNAEEVEHFRADSAARAA